MRIAAFAIAALATPAMAAPVILPSGVQIIDQSVGAGLLAEKGREVTVHYTGWLYIDGKRGKKFDSSRDHGQPFSFLLGGGEVIQGWDEGVAGMKVGGTRTLIIPPEAGYGAEEDPDIPANSTLIFDVQLLRVQ